ncbi:MAG: Pyrophosphate--fructose 6-phosphate 1-phosphotransferase [Planctomycetes bacterium]|nr:Pyrophosphate--fructose 6-phosphate 1-phosphotransferase [Planctomycetota bacterium]
MKRIGVITSGGDAPGTNACVRTIARRGFADGVEVFGIFDSWDGLLKGEVRKLERQDVAGIVQRAGTILRSARSTLFLKQGDAKIAIDALTRQGLEGVVAIGGNGSQTAASLLAQAGFPVVGVPKTIDNDLVGTDFSVGFFTAAEVATQALDNLRATAEAHSRVMIVETMGRDSGWIAVEAGIAGGADLVLIPEHEFTLDAICERLRTRHEVHKRNYSIVIIAEGAMDKDKKLDPRRGTKDLNARPRLGGVGTMLALEIERRLGYNARCTTLGYLQRCAAPIAVDRVLATRLSDFAFDLLLSGKSGLMAALAGRDLEAVPLELVAGKTKLVTDDYFRLAEIFG